MPISKQAKKPARVVTVFALLMATVLISALASAPAWAQRKARPRAGAPARTAEGAPAPAPQGGDSVLDFEGDVIEGQRRRPDLFLQTETQNLSLDAILFLRKDFNDFHSVERLRRPGYFERRRGEGL